MGPSAGPATNESAFTYSGLDVYLWASSTRTMIAAAEPSDTPEQSKMPSCPAMIGLQAMVSLETSFLNCARELSAPLRWFFQAIRVSTSFSSAGSTPYLLAYAGARNEKLAGAVTVSAEPSSAGEATTSPE
ncbi:unannotated protein [freshwater metagenome]|uniref:Unannotated protein n=1 Tax=freshwater metagenome TaxID=449393 RepID=A0A6J7F0Z5_9ZZZZ